MRLAQVILFVKDVSRMLDFYRDALGLTVLEEEEGFVRLDAGGSIVALHAIPARIAANIAIADPPAAREQTPIKLAFHVDDVDAALAALAVRGVVADEVRRFDDVAFCDLLDPEGNVVQITTR